MKARNKRQRTNDELVPQLLTAAVAEDYKAVAVLVPMGANGDLVRKLALVAGMFARRVSAEDRADIVADLAGPGEALRKRLISAGA